VIYSLVLLLYSKRFVGLLIVIVLTVEMRWHGSEFSDESSGDSIRAQTNWRTKATKQWKHLNSSLWGLRTHQSSLRAGCTNPHLNLISI